jgi:Spy/CpxP family protein refolding chaperone
VLLLSVLSLCLGATIVQASPDQDRDRDRDRDYGDEYRDQDRDRDRDRPMMMDRDRYRDDDRGMGMMYNERWRKDLSSEKRGQVDDMNRNMRDNQRQFREQLRNMEQELRQMMTADKPDFAQVEAKLREMEQVRTQHRMLHLRHLGEVRGLLNKEQRRWFDDDMMMGRHQYWRGDD